MKASFRATVFVAVVAFASALGMNAANAASSSYAYYLNGHDVASGGITGPPPVVFSSDDRADGHSALTEWLVGSTWKKCWDHDGSSSSSATAFCASGIGSKTNIKYKVCIGEYSTRHVISCDLTDTYHWDLG